MIAVWFAVVSFMLIAYVALDGRNFGAGMLHWIVAKTPQERRQVVAAIGPLWSWHEVWLVGFGGSLLRVFRLLPGPHADSVGPDPPWYFSRGCRAYQRSPVAGVLGFRFRCGQPAP